MTSRSPQFADVQMPDTVGTVGAAPPACTRMPQPQPVFRRDQVIHDVVARLARKVIRRGDVDEHGKPKGGVVTQRAADVEQVLGADGDRGHAVERRLDLEGARRQVLGERGRREGSGHAAYRRGPAAGYSFDSEIFFCSWTIP